MNQKWIGRGTLVFSVVLHGYLIHAAPRTSLDAKDEPPPNFLELSEIPPEPEPEPVLEVEPEPELDPKVEPEPEPEVEPEIIEEVVEAEPEEAPEPVDVESEPAPPELTGTTLVAEGEGESDFSAEIGSGRGRRGPIVAGVSRPAPARRVVVRKKSRPAVVKKPPPPPQAVPLAQLSKRPVPPDLGGALKKNYPADARRQGRAGEAKVRARVEPSGSVGFAKIASESEHGFGAACRTTLLSSKWTAPLDRSGKPVATWVSYRCKFRID